MPGCTEMGEPSVGWVEIRQRACWSESLAGFGIADSQASGNSVVALSNHYASA
jgi:hypothetical protein